MSSLCSVCNKEISVGDKIKCAGKCEQQFHVVCVIGPAESLKTRGSKTLVKKDWLCEKCKPKTPLHENKKNQPPNWDENSMISAMNTFKFEVRSDIQQYGKQFEEFKVALNHFSECMDQSNLTMKQIMENYKELKKENAKLRTTNNILNEEVNSLKIRMRQIEQYSRKTNVEIQGIPVTEKENVVNIAVDVGAALGLELKKEDVMVAHRVPTYRPMATPPLIVQLRDRRMKDAWITAFKQTRTRGLTANTINSAFPPSKIFVNEHLTPETKNLLRLAKERARELGYAYAWCKEGKVEGKVVKNALTLTLKKSYSF